ncbi:hypothetical protein L1887_06053 [Cichorium endivia]|nr:hypothetical protein L1887_06053 [Cichorium endivia]
MFTFPSHRVDIDALILQPYASLSLFNTSCIQHNDIERCRESTRLHNIVSTPSWLFITFEVNFRFSIEVDFRFQSSIFDWVLIIVQLDIPYRSIRLVQVSWNRKYCDYPRKKRCLPKQWLRNGFM